MRAPAIGACVVASTTRPLNGPCNDPISGASDRTRNGAGRAGTPPQPAIHSVRDNAHNAPRCRLAPVMELRSWESIVRKAEVPLTKYARGVANRPDVIPNRLVLPKHGIRRDMRCSACGHESPPGSSFCLNCGSQFAPAARETPPEPEGLPTICSICRAENPPGMRFCCSCGRSLTYTAAAPGYSAPASRRSSPHLQSGTTCSRCGTVTPAGFAYCQQCGLHLLANPVAEAVPAPISVPEPLAPLAQPNPLLAAAGVRSSVDPQGATFAQSPPASAAPGSAVRAAVPADSRQWSGSVQKPAWGSAVLVNRDGTSGQRFPLVSDDTIIGRAGADISFEDDRFLAPHHARLERFRDGSVIVYALDSVNGIFLKALSPVDLTDGAIILVGREVLRFEIVAAEERSVRPLVRHGVSLFGSPPREPWGRIVQMIPSGGYRDVRHLASPETVIGREEGDILFRDDAFMSRRHAALTWDGNVARITDLGSSNGTFVRIAKTATVKTGDHFRLGDQLLRIELEERG